MKKYFLSLVFIAAGFSAFAAINKHGSIMGKGLPLYPMWDGTVPGKSVEGVTFDFKAVTVGTKTWVWTKLNGKTLAANAWASQFRLWSPAKQEYNLPGRIAGTQETRGIVGIPNVNPSVSSDEDFSCVITFLQEENPTGHPFHVFYETADFTYNYTQPNPTTDVNDQTPPLLDNPSIVDQSERQLRLLLSATDNSGNFFYYIEDQENNFVEISFSNETLLNFEPGIPYRFLIYAVDFSGNASHSAELRLTVSGME